MPPPPAVGESVNGVSKNLSGSVKKTFTTDTADTHLRGRRRKQDRINLEPNQYRQAQHYVHNAMRVNVQFFLLWGRRHSCDCHCAISGSGYAFVCAQHHSQQLSRAAVCGDAQNINNAARNMRVVHTHS